jgi:putative GTP pyrophosphokinase
MESRQDFLTNRAIRFFDRYGDELEQISKLIQIRLNQLALAYTIENKLPKESIIITSRVKTLKSFLKKLEMNGWPEYYYPTEVVKDLIGARVTCWFLDDCRGIYSYIISSRQFHIDDQNTKNYIEVPKQSGYRSIHVQAAISYDRVKSDLGKIKIVPEDMTFEVQVRTKLMDTWADLTHEFHYKAKTVGIDNKALEEILKAQSNRLFSEDESFLAMRNVYQEMISQIQKPNREGFTDEK